METFRHALTVAGSFYFGWAISAVFFAAVSRIGFRLSHREAAESSEGEALKTFLIGCLKCTVLASAIGLLEYFIRAVPFTESHLADTLVLELTLIGGCFARLFMQFTRLPDKPKENLYEPRGRL
jgi:hypothetical protein